MAPAKRSAWLMPFRMWLDTHQRQEGTTGGETPTVRPADEARLHSPRSRWGCRSQAVSSGRSVPPSQGVYGAEAKIPSCAIGQRGGYSMDALHALRSPSVDTSAKLESWVAACDRRSRSGASGSPSGSRARGRRCRGRPPCSWPNELKAQQAVFRRSTLLA